MTGYGEAERATRAGRLRAELKTVNHRFFSANLRLGPLFERYEPQIQAWLREELPRGHVSFSLRLERPGTTADGKARLALDEARAREYLGLLRTLKERLELPGDVDVALLTRFGDIIVPSQEEEIELEAADVQAVTAAAAAAAVKMRELEGGRLQADLEARLTSIIESLDRVEARAPERLVAERDRLRALIAELADPVEPDGDRLAREIAHLAERWDISEELVRLRSHVDAFRAALAADSAEPVGKRLGFLIQEMHREANTIGSKANDAPIDHEVVEIKTEIERLREQVENVE